MLFTMTASTSALPPNVTAEDSGFLFVLCLFCLSPISPRFTLLLLTFYAQTHKCNTKVWKETLA